MVKRNAVIAENNTTTGKELVLQAFANKTTFRTPYVPFVGVHAASLIGKSAEEYLKSKDLIITGLAKSIELYKPDGIPVVFDLQIEAEALGCDLVWAKDNPPAVTSHVLSGKKICDLPLFTQESGRVQVTLDVCRFLSEKYKEIALYGLITGPFTLALHLLGPDIFMEMYDRPEYVHEVLTFCTEIAKKYASWYLDSGADIIAVVDPMTSQIGPADFTNFVSPYCTDVFSAIRKAEGKSSFFVCGHAEKNIDVMCACGPDNVSIDENIPLDKVKTAAAKFGISYGGNMKLTTVMLFGSPEDNIQNALECMDIGQNTGFILAPGCDIPYSVPGENITAVSELVRDPYRQEIARNVAQSPASCAINLDLSDYGGSDKIKLDIITLDSEACAPCQYMVEAVKQIAPEFAGVIEWREHKIKTKAAIELMAALNVKNIPTICIDGKIAFISTIPRKEELIAAVYQRLMERARTHRSASKILVLDDGTEKTETLLNSIGKAQRELGSGVLVERIQDAEKIKQFGISRLPALITIKEELKSFGKIPEKEVIKEWIKNIL